MLMLALTASLALHALPVHAPVRLNAERSARLLDDEEPYHGGEIPEGMHVERRDNDLLIGGGLVAAGGAYLLSLSVASFGMFTLFAYGDLSLLLLAVPLAGPVLAALQPLTFAGQNATLLRGLYYADAALQIGGLIAVIWGYSTRGFILVPDRPGHEVRAQLLPGAPGAGLGTTLHVSF